MTLESIVESYGYLAVGISTFLEGETILVMGGFLAHRGYLELPWVIVVAFLGSFFGDQLYFYLGRRHSQALLGLRPAWQARIGKVRALVERHQRLLILAFRFLYGLRALIPFVIGMSRVPTGLFVLLNFIGGLGWTIAIGLAGYLFGQALEIGLQNIEHYEREVLAVIAAAGILLWLFHGYRRCSGTNGKLNADTVRSDSTGVLPRARAEEGSRPDWLQPETCGITRAPVRARRRSGGNLRETNRGQIRERTIPGRRTQ